MGTEETPVVEQLGIEQIKELMDYGFDWAFRVKEVTAADSPGGPKLTFTEIVGSVGLVFRIPSIISAAPIAYKQWKDVDLTEKTELEDHFKAKFDIPNEKWERAAEKMWSILVQLGEFIAIFEEE